MARTLISIDAGPSWTALGNPGLSTVTIQRVGTGGQLLLNTSQVDDTAQVVTNNRLLNQFTNNSATEQLYARATTDGWQVIFDQE